MHPRFSFIHLFIWRLSIEGLPRFGAVCLRMEKKADESYSKSDGRGKEINKYIQIIMPFSKCYEVSVGSQPRG